MTRSPHILFVGVGSPHGDDLAGWLIASALSPHFTKNDGVQIRKAAVPPDILDWLHDIDELHICDASRGEERVGTIHRSEVPPSSMETDQLAAGLGRLIASGSHDYGLSVVLDLAERLGKLPNRIVVHAIAGQRFRPGDEMSEELASALPEITRSILNELYHARGITGAVAADSG